MFYSHNRTSQQIEINLGFHRNIINFVLFLHHSSRNFCLGRRKLKLRAYIRYCQSSMSRSSFSRYANQGKRIILQKMATSQRSILNIFLLYEVVVSCRFVSYYSNNYWTVYYLIGILNHRIGLFCKNHNFEKKFVKFRVLFRN